jgi:vacuolar-type H+-ATPase subunit D/Vma8
MMESAFYKPTNKPVHIHKSENEVYQVITFDYQQITCDRNDLLIDPVEIDATIEKLSNVLEDLIWLRDVKNKP